MIRALSLALFPALLLAGCPKGGLGDLGLDRFMPKLSFKRLKLNDIDFKAVDTDFVFTVSNPNPLKVKLASFSYDLDLGGAGFLQGQQEDGFTLEARGDSALAFPVKVVYTDLFDMVKGLKGKDTVPFTFAGKFGFGTPLGEVKIPFKETGDFPVVRAPRFGVKGVRVGKLDLLRQSATVEVDLTVAHNGGSTVDLSQFDYALTFGGKRVVDGLVKQLTSVDKGETAVVSLPVTLNLLQLGTTVADAIIKKEKLKVGLDAGVKVGTPFGKIPLSIDEAGRVLVK